MSVCDDGRLSVGAFAGGELSAAGAATSVTASAAIIANVMPPVRCARIIDPARALFGCVHPLLAPLAEHGAQRGRLDRLVEQADVRGAHRLANAWAAIGGDQDGRRTMAEPFEDVEDNAKT